MRALRVILLLAGIPQSEAPHYTAAMLACAAFREEVRSEIRNESGNVLRDERAGRDGVLLVQAIRGDSGMALTAWYDSLLVWREGPEGRDTPDTEGLLGGRWRGALTPLGRYDPQQLPFIPDDVAEVTDLRGVLADFFPRLPHGALRVGGTELLAEGWTIRRGGDGAGAAGPLDRFTWTIRTRSDTSGAMNDSLSVPMQREIREEGTLSWDRRRGPIRWERSVTVSGRIEAKGAITRGIRSTVVQRIRVIRLTDRPCD